MSAKTWIKDSGGMYTETPIRGARAGETVYKARIWIKSRQDFAHFYLGLTPKQAERRMREILGDPESALAERNERPAAAAPTFEAMVKAFLAGYKSRGESGYYAMVSVSWLVHFGKATASDRITRAMVEDYRDTLRRDGYGDSTIRKYVGALGTMYRWSIGRGLLTVNPVQDVKRPSEPDREVAVLSRDQEAEFLKVTDLDDRIAVRLFLESGMRLSEGLSLRWSQVDRTGEAILIHKSKTGKARSIPLNARLTAVLEDAKKDRFRHKSEYVLCDGEGKPLDRFILARRVESALERAGIVKVKGTGMNLLRHTFGSRLAEKGFSFGAISKVMGNSAAMCERHYIRFSPEHLKAMMASLDAVTAPPTAPGSDPEAGRGAGEQSEAVAS